MPNTKPLTHVIPVRARTTSKTDAVFAVTKRGRGRRVVRVSEAMPYGAAVERYSRMEAYLRHCGPAGGGLSAAASPLGAGGGPVLYLMVRSMADPRYAAAPRCTAVLRGKAARKARATTRAI